MKLLKKAYLLCPLLIFPLLLVPYSILNNSVLVKIFGCGCPKFDEDTGMLMKNQFNANSFTALFWSVIAVVVVICSLFLMKKLSHWRIKLLYVIFTAGISFSLTNYFCQLMMWR